MLEFRILVFVIAALDGEMSAHAANNFLQSVLNLNIFVAVASMFCVPVFGIGLRRPALRNQNCDLRRHNTSNLNFGLQPRMA